MNNDLDKAAATSKSQRLYVYNGGFLTQKRVRRIIELSGYEISLGAPSEGDAVGVWGHSPTSPRGEAVAEKRDAPVIRVEDPFLRSVQTGRDGAPPLGLLIDRKGVHFDPSTPSELEEILRDDPLDDFALLERSKGAIGQIQRLSLSKYNMTDPTLPPLDPGYVLVIDQTRKDASIKASGCDLNTFREMLYYAQTDHPSARILIKTHPETTQGHREGYYTEADCNERISIIDAPYTSYDLFEGAIAVYTVSSQMGFEAILTGHKPVVFGQPFYMGWGLTDDRKPLQRRQRSLTRAQLFAGAMVLYPRWYDPYHDRLCQIEDVIAALEAQTRAWRDDHQGWAATGMSRWKHEPLQRFFGTYGTVQFADAPFGGTRHMAWGDKPANGNPMRIEDGFIRSKGLGAELVPPLSLVLDDLGIYYDPTGPSRLETLIEDSSKLSKAALLRAEKLLAQITKKQLSKYNIGEKNLPPLPAGRRILVPGQVEDDASIRLGTTEVSTNLQLLKATRAANPAAVLLYKPHPDVEAGLRPGAVPNANDIADVVLDAIDPIIAIEKVDEVWTMTSLLGFEALIRGKRVTCLGSPFYSGWGLTDDRAMPIPRRTATPSLSALAHAVLIDYPRYFDPVTGQACPPEVVVERLAKGELPSPAKSNRLLSKLQGIFASYAHLWRR